MTTEADFIRAICETPGDDTPRLVYADWLEERGQPARAEFIRVQCAIARHDGYGSSDIERDINRSVADAFRRRERELFSNYSGEWVRPLADQFGLELRGWAGLTCGHADPRRDFGWLWHRGFIDEIRLPPAAFVGAAGELFQAHPVTRVVLSGMRPERVEGFEMTRESGWTWFVGDANAGHTAHHVTNDLWRHMRQSWWRSEDAALTALSAACVAYGRKEARLPALPPCAPRGAG